MDRTLPVLLATLAAVPPAGAAKTPPVTLTLVTWNVLASAQGADARIPKLLEVLDRAEADVIALQEVAPWFLRRLWQQGWVRERGYRGITGPGGKPRAPGGLYFLSRRPISDISFHTLPGRQGRGALVVHVDVAGTRLAFGTVHLESFLPDGKVRAQQMDVVFPLLGKSEDAILLGDVNFGQGAEPESGHVPAGFTDVWAALSPNDPGLTWNNERNGLARANRFPGEESRRIDRVFLRSGRCRPAAIVLIGDEPVKAGSDAVFPSDHFGLRATLRCAIAQP